MFFKAQNSFQVTSYSALTRTAATGSDTATLQGTDDDPKAGADANPNTVEGRNREFIKNFVAVSAPTCS